MKCTIEEVEVDFPFEPYPCQITFMESVIKALKTSSNAILESPTGTGKTLCLLCAAIAYQQYHRAKEGQVLKIYYSSRTHSQLSQVIRELKSTSYPISVRTAVLGSRDQLCVNTIVNTFRGSILNASCRSLLRRKACSYAEKVSRENQRFADIIFLPYNYIVDPQESMDSLKAVELRNSIVIIDEAHNLERVCEDSASIVFGQYDLSNGLSDVEKAISFLSSDLQDTVRGDDRRAERGEVQQDQETLVKLEKFRDNLKNLSFLISKVDLTQVDNSGRKERAIIGNDVIELFANAGFNRGSKEALVQTIDRAQEILTAKEEVSLMTTSLMTGGLQAVRDIVCLLFSMDSGSQFDTFFRAFVQNGDHRIGGEEAERNRVISLFCLSAAVAMRNLVEKKGVRSILLASGTLSPMSLLQQSLGIPFPVILQNTHVIDPRKQIRVSVLCKGPNTVTLNSSYQNKNQSDYLKDLGNTVVNIAHIVPEGMLLVFHAYAQMYAVIKHWSDNGIWARINREKAIFVEPRNAGELGDVLRQFALESGAGGAILFCVCRGKITEGVDLSDNQCRAVVMAGIPFPAIHDRKINLKKEYLDAINPGDGAKWYRQEAARAVNQTIGRVIRHKKDYGVIVLADDRFVSFVSPKSNELPGWIDHSIVTKHIHFGSAVKEISDFFKELPVELLNHRSAKSYGRSLNKQPSVDAAAILASEKQLDSIQKLIAAGPVTRILENKQNNVNVGISILPSIGNQAFKISTASGSNDKSASGSSKFTSSLARTNSNAVPNTPNDTITISQIEWIQKMKNLLSRKEYLSLKMQLRRLLEGAHGQCDITVSEALIRLRILLANTNMISSFEPIIAGTNSLLRTKWKNLEQADPYINLK